MKIGDMVQAYVSTSDAGERKELRRGRVVYIHPRGRFYTVEFESNGRKYRESYRP